MYELGKPTEIMQDYSLMNFSNFNNTKTLKKKSLTGK